MLVLNSEQGPDTSAAYLREADKKAEQRGVLQLVGEYGIEDPIETEYGVDGHGEVVHPRPFVAQDVTEKGVLGVWIAQT